MGMGDARPHKLFIVLLFIRLRMKSNTINRLTAGNLVLGCLRHGPDRQMAHLSLVGDVTSNSYATSPRRASLPCGSLAAQKTLKPALAKARAVATPMPLEAPVTTALFSTIRFLRLAEPS